MRIAAPMALAFTLAVTGLASCSKLPPEPNEADLKTFWEPKGFEVLAKTQSSIGNEVCALLNKKDSNQLLNGCYRFDIADPYVSLKPAVR